MKSFSRCTTVCFVVALTIAPASVQAANTEQDEAIQIPVVKLRIQPAAEPRPALRYSLLPGFLDLKPGNAALMYNKIALQLEGDSVTRKSLEKITEWLKLPLDKLPQEEAQRLLNRAHNILGAIDRAARREHCDWQLPLREGNPVAMLLPELSKCRDMGRLLAFQARLQIKRGDFDDALRTLQTGYALGRHVAEGPTLVNALVGIAICGMMSDQVLEFVQQPDAPNLYWALTSLPRPLIDLRRAAEVEMNMVYLMYPVLQELDEEAHSVEFWRVFVDRALKEMEEDFGVESPKLGLRPMLIALAIKGYPQARQALIQEGRTPDDVDALPVAEVVVRYSLQTYNELRDETFKWFALPYNEASPGISRSDELLQEGLRREVFPLASLLLPAVGSAKLAEARTDRDIALLRTIEALRMYAADGESRLPKTLSDVTEVPVPLDPATGKPFVYRLIEDRAVVQAPAPPGRSNGRDAKHFEIELLKDQ